MNTFFRLIFWEGPLTLEQRTIHQLMGVTVLFSLFMIQIVLHGSPVS